MSEHDLERRDAAPRARQRRHSKQQPGEEQQRRKGENEDQTYAQPMQVVFKQQALLKVTTLIPVTILLFRAIVLSPPTGNIQRHDSDPLE